MTFDQFEFLLGRLKKAFSVSRADDRAEAYWPKLKDFDATIFSHAIDKVLDTEERFPSLARLKKICNELTPVAQSKYWGPCSICDGHGNVFIWGVAYRGSCEHGKQLNEAIRVAPSNEVAIESERRKQQAAQLQLYGRVIEPRRLMPEGHNDPHWWL